MPATSSTTNCPRCAQVAEVEQHASCVHCGYRGPVTTAPQAAPMSLAPSVTSEREGRSESGVLRDIPQYLDERIMAVRHWIAAAIALIAWSAAEALIVALPLVVILPFVVRPVARAMVPATAQTDEAIDRTLQAREAVCRTLLAAAFTLLAAVGVLLTALAWPVRSLGVVLLVAAVGSEIYDLVRQAWTDPPTD